MSKKVSRRRFLMWAGNLGLVGIAGAAVKGSLWFLSPPVTHPAVSAVDVGAVGDFPAGARTFIPAAKAWLIRDEGGFFAMSAVCPHLGCTLGEDGADFACPCHGSRFNRTGDVTHGPAISPMRFPAVEVAGERVIIHPERAVSADTRA